MEPFLTLLAANINQIWIKRLIAITGFTPLRRARIQLKGSYIKQGP